MKLLEKKRDELADAHTSSTYFHLEYSTFGKTAKECNNSFREGFNAAIKELEPVLKELTATLENAEKVIYDSTEMFAHYDDCVALVTDEDEPDYECTCGRDKMVIRTIDIRFLIKEVLQKYKQLIGEKEGGD